MSGFFKGLIHLLMIPPYIIMATFVYWWIQTFFPAISFYITSYEPTTVEAGGAFYVHQHIDVYKPDCPYTVTRFLQDVNNPLHLIVLRTAPRTIFKTGDYDFDVHLPDNVPDGKYYYRIEVEQHCSPLDRMISNIIRLQGNPVIVTVDNTPQVLYDSKLKHTVIKEGQALVVSNHFFRRRQCDTTINRFVFDEKGIIVAKFTRQGISIGLGDNTITEELELKLPPGKYRIRSQTVSECVNKTYIQVYPDVEFEITTS